ncbi:uncharacterized protein LOC123404363 [Hordeum vulgare subsp. vulgare]|uniref:Predicted protein n=1 Tax=Hordeum vulgare subsp. vulgare TaxID=112509 RepID=F2DEM3_HORVV|nr:uncharacterized protein LOC123404363 [Hordeum vulgare subsp. vulgare]BAJ93544.1 predicted protein [Hordeum vulgare subsp. vulgare]
MVKHFECSNVHSGDFVKFATFHLKGQAVVWWQQLKDSTGGRMISWDDFYRDFRSHYIPTNFVEEMCEKFQIRRARSISSEVVWERTCSWPLPCTIPMSLISSITWLSGLRQLCSEWRIRGSISEIPAHRPQLRWSRSNRNIGCLLLLGRLSSSSS